ncbi:MAG: hypothetical protein JGK01_25000, partial [Microcoleus sp. PH2017_03_ELD_O_A]|nr:hypothetical protein [Microcoleus sp. PH2017_03_ELD_O_A]
SSLLSGFGTWEIRPIQNLVAIVHQIWQKLGGAKRRDGAWGMGHRAWGMGHRASGIGHRALWAQRAFLIPSPSL